MSKTTMRRQGRYVLIQQERLTHTVESVFSVRRTEQGFEAVLEVSSSDEFDYETRSTLTIAVEREALQIEDGDERKVFLKLETDGRVRVQAPARLELAGVQFVTHVYKNWPDATSFVTDWYGPTPPLESCAEEPGAMRLGGAFARQFAALRFRDGKLS